MGVSLGVGRVWLAPDISLKNRFALSMEKLTEVSVQEYRTAETVSGDQSRNRR